jgi:hypothetical protein
MITIFQADKNYKNHRDYDILSRNLDKLEKNGNNYFFHIDTDEWISYIDLKINKLLTVLKNYDDDVIIMYIDALDTSVEATDKEIEEKFLAFDTDVLYSSEKGVWPNPDFAKFFPDNFFLNSGTIIFKNIKYQKILEIISTIQKGRLTYDCDQYYHSMFALISLSNIKISIDKSNQIFQCLVSEDENNFEIVDNRLKNKNTNTFPCVFHGNGTDGRKNIRKFLGYDIQKIDFLGFVEDNMGINFMNSSHPFDKIKVYAEIKNIFNQVVFSDYLELQYNVSYFIHTGIKDNYFFTIYDMNNQILLQEKNY